MRPANSRNPENQSDTATGDAKRHARARARAVRKARHRDEQSVGSTHKSAADAMARVFMNAIALPDGATVAGYWPTNSEIDCRALMNALHSKGMALALPVVEAAQAPLVFRAWRPNDRLVEDQHGVAAPTSDAPVVAPTLVIVPLLAFDRSGHRLGQGGGYYDRTLAAFRADQRSVRTCGVAYDAQLFKHLPHDSHDQSLDAVVTEIRTYMFNEHPLEGISV